MVWFTSVAQALDMARETPLVLMVKDSGDRYCVVTEGPRRVGMRLTERIPGSGAWSVLEVSVREQDGEPLTATALRDLPLARIMRQAVEAVLTTTGRVVFAQPSDPPPAFLESRRGRARRTDRDFALLAAAYLAVGDEHARIQLPRTWAARWPDALTVDTWRNRLSEARKYIAEDGETLTDEGMGLVYGPDWIDGLAVEVGVDKVEKMLQNPPADEDRQRARRDGIDLDRPRRRAQRQVDGWYGDSSE